MGGPKGKWVYRMLNPHCDFEVWPHPWPWPLIFKVKFWKSCNSGMGCRIDMEQTGCELTECWNHVVISTSTSPWPWIFNIKFWNSCIPGMGGLINMEQKGYKSIRCYTYYVTLNYDLDLRFSRSYFKNALSQEWEGWLTWNQKDRMLDSVTLWL